MDQEKARRAGWAGLATLVFFGAALVVLVLSQLTGANPIFGGGQPTTITYLGSFLAAPAVAALGGALPGRALGAGWMPSLLASGAGVASLFLGGLRPRVAGPHGYRCRDGTGAGGPCRVGRRRDEACGLPKVAYGIGAVPGGGSPSAAPTRRRRDLPGLACLGCPARVGGLGPIS